MNSSRFFSVLLIGLISWGLYSCGEIKQEGTHFRVALIDSINGLDPHLSLDTISSRVHMNLFDPLFYLRTNGEHVSLEPALAQSFEQDRQDPTLYTITLREDLLWSDGMPLTTDDVMFSYERLFTQEEATFFGADLAQYVQGAQAFYDGLVPFSEVGVKQLDKQRFSIKSNGAYPFFLQMLGHSYTAIVPKHAIEEHGKQWTQAEHYITSGPYVLEAYLLKNRITLGKNPFYWDKDNVAIDRVSYLVVEDANTAYNMYNAGEVDWAPEGIPVSLLPVVVKQPDFFWNPLYAIYAVVFNLRDTQDIPLETRRALQSKKVRQALALVIDKQELTSNFLENPELATNFLAGQRFVGADYQPKSLGNQNIVKARNLLAEAGYPGGEGFPPVTFLYATLEFNKQVAEYLQAQWKRHLGVSVDLENVEWKFYLERQTQGRFEMVRFGWIGDYLDPTSLLKLFYSGAPHNRAAYNNPVYDELLDRASQEYNVDKRYELLAEAETILLEDAPFIPVYFPQTGHLFNIKQWGGFKPHPKGQFLIKDYYAVSQT